MKTYKVDPKENFDDFADEVTYGCEKMGLKDDERENSDTCDDSSKAKQPKS